MNKVVFCLILLIGNTAWSYEKFVLDNGFTVYLEKNNQNPLVAIQLWVNVGSADETESTNGISHFTEHMILKGTTNYSGENIGNTIGKYGNHIGAWTTKKQTFFSTEILAEGLPDVLSVFSEIAKNAVFDENDIENEKRVVLEEYSTRKDDPMSLINSTFFSLVFPSSTYRMEEIGTVKNINSFNRIDLLSHYEKYYTAKNMMLIVVGDISVEDTMKLINAEYSSLKSGQKNENNSVEVNSYKHTYEEYLKKIPQTLIKIGIVVPSNEGKDYFSDKALIEIIHSGYGSRVNRELKEDLNLISSVSAEYAKYVGMSIIFINIECPCEYYKSVLKQVNLVFGRPITEEELDRAKEQLKTGIYISRSSVEGIASDIAEAITYNLPYNVEDQISMINSLNSRELGKYKSENYNKFNAVIFNPYQLRYDIPYK